MKINIKNIALFIMLVIISFILIPSINNSQYTITVYINFAIIGMISIFMLINESKKNPVSLNMIHWLFILFFFVIAPTVQLVSGFKTWGVTYTDKEVINSQLIIYTWIVFYILGNIFQKKTTLRSKDNEKPNIIFKEKNTGMFILTLLSLICTMFLISKIGFFNLFSRGTYSFDLGEGKTTNLLVDNTIRAIIVYTACISIINYKVNKNKRIYLIVNVLLLLIACFPSGLARNAAGAIYIGLFILLYYDKMNKFKNSYKFIIVFLLAFVIIFPTFSAFRRTNFSEVNILVAISNVMEDLTSNYNSEDYDAFTMVGQTKEFVDAYGPTYGRQLLGTLLFFVPRNIWLNKPTGSGHTIFSTLGKKFTNVSCPLVAEGYINFGIIGVILFSFILGYFCSKIDKKYWDSVLSNKSKGNYITIIYPFLIGNYFFMLRGDLMSSFAYTMAYVVVFYLLTTLLIIINKKI